MALTSRQRNNIIILVTALMIIVLTLMNRFTNRAESDTHPLFDENTPLEQLQLNKHWLAKQNSKWLCDDTVLNCNDWADAWISVRIRLLTEAPETYELPDELIIKIKRRSTPQTWLFFPEQGLLKTSNNNWYEIPKRYRQALSPISNIKQE